MKSFKEFVNEKKDRIKRLDLEGALEKLDIDYTISKDDPSGFEITITDLDPKYFDEIRDIISRDFDIKLKTHKKTSKKQSLLFKY